MYDLFWIASQRTVHAFDVRSALIFFGFCNFLAVIPFCTCRILSIWHQPVRSVVPHVDFACATGAAAVSVIPIPSWTRNRSKCHMELKITRTAFPTFTTAFCDKLVENGEEHHVKWMWLMMFSLFVLEFSTRSIRSTTSSCISLILGNHNILTSIPSVTRDTTISCRISILVESCCTTAIYHSQHEQANEVAARPGLNHDCSSSSNRHDCDSAW